MQISVLGNEGSWYVEELNLAATARGHNCSRGDFQLLSSNIAGTGHQIHSAEHLLSDFDAIIVRTMPPGSLEQVIYRMDVLAQLQQLGKTVLNHPKSIECAVDKYLTTARLAAAGLRVPDTIVCESTEQAMEAFSTLGEDIVLKPIFGAEGRGIARLSDPDIAYRAFRTLQRLNNVLYLQKYIQHAGYDVRVLVLNGQVVGGMKRQNANDFRTNISREGIASIHSVTDQEANFALSAAKSVDACFAGVDLLYDPAGNCFVIEVNAVPGWRAFQKTTNINVAERVIQYLEKQ